MTSEPVTGRPVTNAITTDSVRNLFIFIIITVLSKRIYEAGRLFFFIPNLNAIDLSILLSGTKCLEARRRNRLFPSKI